MIKRQILVISMLFNILLLTCCTVKSPIETETKSSVTLDIPSISVPIQAKAEYIKLTSQEAHDMMSDDVIILDVRTQEEFDEGHIANAVLLPDYEIKEKAESVIANKDQTILIYCRTGRRSEIASKELIEMGYKNVFDFGGIVDWTGEIVWEATNTIFYNYFGGELPPDIVTPIDFLVSRKINDQMPEFAFHITGTNEKRHGLNHDNSRYCIMFNENKVEKITITDNSGALIQEIGDLYKEIDDIRTANPASEEDMYGFSFDDWNFDGYLDISLWKYPGGSMRNKPTYFWLWDAKLGKFIENEELGEMSDYSTISVSDEGNLIESFTRVGGGEYGIGYYKCENGKYICVKTKHVKYEPTPDNENKYVSHIVISELVNGKMTVTKDYFEDESY